MIKGATFCAIWALTNGGWSTLLRVGGSKVRGWGGCAETNGGLREQLSTERHRRKNSPFICGSFFSPTTRSFQACDGLLKIHCKSWLYIMSCFNMWIGSSRGSRSIRVSAVPDRSMMSPDAAQPRPQFRLRHQKFIIYSLIDDFGGSAGSPSIPLGLQSLWERREMLTLRIRSVSGSSGHYCSHCRSSLWVKRESRSRIRMKSLVGSKEILRNQGPSDSTDTSVDPFSTTR